MSSLSRLSTTRSSRTSTLNNGTSIPPPVPSERPRSKSSEDAPTISLDPPASSNTVEDIDIDINTSEPDELLVPTIVTPRLPPVSPMQPRHPRQQEEIESSDDDSDINIDIPKLKPAAQSSSTKPDPDEDVSDGDLDDLANELESSLENGPGSSSSDVDSDFPGPPKPKAPNLNNVPRSGGPISMSRFAGGRRRQEESSSSESSDDED